MADAYPKYSDLDLEFAKLLKCINVVGKKAMCDIAKKIYSCRKMNTNNGSKPLRSFIEENNIQAEFEEEDFLLDCNITKREFDIPFACRIIKVVCNCVYEELSNHCQNKITFIDHIADHLCFEYNRNLTLSKIQTTVKYLKESLSVIYEGLAKIINKGVPKSQRVNFSTQVQKMQESIENITKGKMSVSTKALEEFKEQLFFKIVQSAMREVLEIYDNQKKYKILDPRTWIDSSEGNRFDLDTVFTSPELTQNQSKIKMDEMLTVQALKGGKQETPATLIIIGEAGSGKTSLCHYIVNTWTKEQENISGLSKFQLLLLVEIRRTSACSLEEFLKTQLMVGTFKTFAPKDVLNALTKMKVLIVVDGYDEGNKNSDKLLHDIFKTFQNNRVILTSRTCTLNKVLKIISRHNIQSLSIDLHGFNTVSRKCYITRVFGGLKVPHKGINENCERFQKYIEGRGQVLREHLNLPLTIALLIVLWLDDPENVNNVTTATSLYQELFKLFQKKLMERLISQRKFQNGENLPLLLEKILLKLGEQAWHMLKECADSELTHEFGVEIKEECDKYGIDSTEFLCAFLKCDIDRDRDSKPNVYSFLHRTQTEYVAALFLADLINGGKTEALHQISSEVENWEQYQQLLLYLTGNMALRKTLMGLEAEILELIARGNVDYSYYAYWWNLVSESLINYEIHEFPHYSIQYKDLVHPEIGKIIAQNEKFLSNYAVWEPDDRNIAAALRLIALIPVCVQTLKIDIPENIEPLDILDFIEAIEDVGKHRFKSQGQIETELRLRRHILPGCINCSDRFLRATQGWANLTVFAGSIRHRMDLRKIFPRLKNISCKITTPEVLKSLKNLAKHVRVLRITIGFSQECSPSSLQVLGFKGELEFTFHHIKEENVQWMKDVLIKLTGRDGFESLYLENSELDYGTLELLIHNLNGRLHKRMQVNRNGEPDEKIEETLVKGAHFRMEWSD
ncbi:uncharacterized protein [Palaemon carinicauda]|uniref:uncharacterized protein n=1 Tax=Palaemon carinicauda TaxID=392227 RepID=UPI0035B6870C